MKTREFQKYDYYTWDMRPIEYTTGTPPRLETIPARVGEAEKNGDLLSVLIGGDYEGDMGIILAIFLDDVPAEEDIDLRNYYTYRVGGPVTLADVQKVNAIAEDILTQVEKADDAFVILRQFAKKYDMQPAVQR